MIDFSFTKAQEEFTETVKRFAREEVKPKREIYDKMLLFMGRIIEKFPL